MEKKPKDDLWASQDLPADMLMMEEKGWWGVICESEGGFISFFKDQADAEKYVTDYTDNDSATYPYSIKIVPSGFEVVKTYGVDDVTSCGVFPHKESAEAWIEKHLELLHDKQA